MWEDIRTTKAFCCFCFTAAENPGRVQSHRRRGSALPQGGAPQKSLAECWEGRHANLFPMPINRTSKSRKRNSEGRFSAMLGAVVYLAATGGLAFVVLRGWPSASWLAVRVAVVLFICIVGTAFAGVSALKAAGATEPAPTMTVTAAPLPAPTSYVTVTVRVTTTTPSQTPPVDTNSHPPLPPKALSNYYLFNMQHIQVEGCCNWDPRPAPINGKLFAKSVGADQRGIADALGDTISAQYNLGRKCKRLMFTAGITDDSDSGTSGRFEVQLDSGNPKFSRDIRFGSSVAGSVDVTNALRLKLSITSLTHTALVAAFGDARLTCSDSVLPTR